MFSNLRVFKPISQLFFRLYSLFLAAWGDSSVDECWRPAWFHCACSALCTYAAVAKVMIVVVMAMLLYVWYFLHFTGDSYLFWNRFKWNAQGICTHRIFILTGIGNCSQGANINISFNLMNLLRNITAITSNIHQIIENYMTPISHFDVHGTRAVCLTHLCFVTNLQSAKWSAPLNLPCWLQHIPFMNVSSTGPFPLTKLLQLSLALLPCLIPIFSGQFCDPCWVAEPCPYEWLQWLQSSSCLLCLLPFWVPWGQLSQFLVACVELHAP